MQNSKLKTATKSCAAASLLYAFQNSKVIYSKDLPEIWHDEVAVDDYKRQLKWFLVFEGMMPKTVNLQIRLAGYGSRAELALAFLGKESQETSVEITMVHDAPETYGRITAKAALFDQSRFIFRGMLEVTPRGKKSDTHLSAKGLMLSPHARAEIYPHLEIKTDEVRCSHGTSVGRIDENILFYLQSRGVGKHIAENIFLSGYFRDIVAEIPSEYRKKFCPV